MLNLHICCGGLLDTPKAGMYHESTYRLLHCPCGIGVTGQTGLTGVTGATGLSGMLFDFNLTSLPVSDMGACIRVKALILTMEPCICHHDWP